MCYRLVYAYMSRYLHLSIYHYGRQIGLGCSLNKRLRKVELGFHFMTLIITLGLGYNDDQTIEGFNDVSGY